MEVNDSQAKENSLPMLVMVGGSVTEEKTSSPMLVIVCGSVTEVNDSQPKKTALLMIVTVSGILIYRSEVQSINAISLIDVTVVCTSTVVTFRRHRPFDPR